MTAVSVVAPGMANDEALSALLGSRNLGVLATLKRDGRPQLSNVTHFYDAENRRILVSLTDGRAKTKNLRRDPRASYHVTSEDGWSYVVAEGDAELSAVAADPHDAAVEELIDLYRKVQGEHPDWDDYRRAMVEDRRLVLRLPVTRVYGMAR
ncbi:PPOX class F420-dependent oxidoreductase [Amycolatopsis minnesotensis]|uniref:PPOX class F420-dependent oxidoreductase n=2 Tax=Amycolatopsis minnesotensis TaxID=337894 RepID=A0ABN2S4P2_9PSEU